MKFWAKFSLTIPSEAAKKAKMWLMKWRSLSESLTQSAISEPRSISSAVQKEASAFLYISHSLSRFKIVHGERYFREINSMVQEI